MKLKSVGFYKELSRSDKYKESIFDSINSVNSFEKEKVCKYLEDGLVLVVVPETSEDVINPEKGVTGTSSEKTDGTWLWPEYLSYYVRNYNLKLPDDFLETMQKNNCNIPITE